MKLIIKRISIPYGAIKRDKKINRKKLKNLFQFLMVRLKDYNVAKDLFNRYEISIPYGAIKSFVNS